MSEPWSLSGDYFECCNCAVACPCVFGSDPTQGNCTVLVGWHVRKGHSGKETLDDLSFALAAYTPGNMWKTKWDVAIYVDERATPAQRKALESILGGQVGGPMAGFGSLIGKVLGFKFAPISFHAEGKKRSLTIRGIASMRSAAIAGAGGAEVKLSGAPMLLAPEVTVAQHEQLSLTDYSWKWEGAGGNSYYSSFDWKGP